MAKYKIAWMPGDGGGHDVMEAARMVLDRLQLDAEYVPSPAFLPVLDGVEGILQHLLNRHGTVREGTVADVLGGCCQSKAWVCGVRGLYRAQTARFF
jgi:hypothetical protein